MQYFWRSRQQIHNLYTNKTLSWKHHALSNTVPNSALKHADGNHCTDSGLQAQHWWQVLQAWGVNACRSMHPCSACSISITTQRSKPNPPSSPCQPQTAPPVWRGCHWHQLKATTEQQIITTPCLRPSLKKKINKHKRSPKRGCFLVTVNYREIEREGFWTSGLKRQVVSLQGGLSSSWSLIKSDSSTVSWGAEMAQW